MSNYTPESLFFGGLAILLGIAVIFLIFYKLFRKARPRKFRKKWQKMQKKLSRQENWKIALIDADKLLDSALKRHKKVKGDSMGERLVSAEKMFKEKDEVWFAHKLRRNWEKKPAMKVDKKTIKRALLALRQALKDLGAL